MTLCSERKGKEMMTEFSEEKVRISSQLENAFSKAAEIGVSMFQGTGMLSGAREDGWEKQVF